MSVDRINLTTTLGTNTGKTSGDVRMGRIKALLPTRGKVFTQSERTDSDSFKDALETAMLLSRADANKVFVLAGFREAEDGTGDPQTQTLADGYEEVLNDPLVKAVLKHTKGAAQTQSYAAFNGWNDYVLVVDDKNVVWGINDGNGGMKGFQVGFMYSSAPKFGGTGAINTNQTRITFGSVDEFKLAGLTALKIDFSVEDLMPIVDVELKEFASATGYAFKIGALTKFAGTNIYDTYKDLLAVVGAWKATLLSDGSDITIASAAKDDTNKCWTVTLASSPTIAAGAKIKIELVDPTTLAGLTTPVEGIEGIYVKVAKP